MIFETLDIRSESHISKLAERMWAPLSSMRIQPQPQQCACFRMLWWITMPICGQSHDLLPPTTNSSQ